MARTRSIMVTVLFILLISSTILHALSAVELTEEQLINKAEMIVIGKVLSAYSQKDDRSGEVVTFITVRVTDQIKGKHRSQEIVLKTYGGRVQDEIVSYPGSADFYKNEEVLLFLERRADKSLMPIGMMLGKYSIYRDSETGKKIALRQIDGNGHYFPFPREEETYRETDSRLFLNEFRARIQEIVGTRR